MKHFLFIVSLLSILAVTKVYGQHQEENRFSGQVVSASSKKPLGGTTIRIKGGQKVWFTDDNGRFSIEQPFSSDTLIFSHIGYQTKYLPMDNYEKKDSIIELTPQKNALNEVVVSTGYQNIPKERATGSFGFISNEMLNQQVGTNILDRIKGVASGVLFKTNKNDYSKTNITIRGLSTINGPLDPLIVLDGFIYEGDIGNINPNDVENITILKDAAATSIWGARAGNGVIVINTKKGHFNQKLQVSFNANVIVHSKPDLFNLPQISSADYIDVEQFLFNQGYFDNTINRQYMALTPAVEIFLKRREGMISATDSASQINALKAIDSRDQYLKYFYTHAITQQYAINFRGGGKKYAYKFSAAYDNNLSSLSAKSKKLNIGIENLFQPLKNLKLSLNIYYTNEHSTSGKYTNIEINGKSVPYLKFMDNNGDALPIDKIYKGDYTDTLAGGKLLDWKFYPLEDWKHSITTDNLQGLYTNIGIQYKLTDFLNIDLKYQYQNQQIKTERLYDLESYYARDMINLFTQVDRSSDEVNYIVPMGAIRATGNDQVKSSTARGQLNFNYSWGNNSIAAIVGGEARERKRSGDNSIVYGYNADPLYFSNVDFVNYYPTILGGYQGIPGNFASYIQTYRFVSFYGNASYIYKNRYIASASARKDGANIFGLNTNDKWEPLWSAGLAWKISKEWFYNSSFIPILKLRVTYGYNGNIDPSKTAQAVGRYGSGALYTYYPYVRIQAINNPDLKWERTGMLNIGVDFTAKNQIFSGSIEYYHKKDKDLYGPTPIDYTTGGWNTIVKNVAEIKGNGIDLVFNSKNIDRSFKWNTRLLLNYNTNKTTRYYSSNAKKISRKLSAENYIVPVIGKPLYAIAAYKWGGLNAKGDPQGYVNGQLSTDYRAIIEEGYSKGIQGNIIYIGPSSPTFFGSLINVFSWKGISISANISYKFGYYFRKPSISYSALIKNGNGNKEYENRWKNPGDESKTNVPSFIYPVDEKRDGFYNDAKINVLKADHIRLQYVNLTYTLPNTMPELPFSDMQLYLNIANIGILWRANRKGLDPDYPFSVPPERTYAFGIRINF